MKILKHKTLHFINVILGGLLSLLGFTTCEERMCEYGTPMADFGGECFVVNEQGQGIQGIQVTLTDENNELIIDTLYTDKNGRVAMFSGNSLFYPVNSAKIISEDIDGDENGAYQTDITTVPLEYKGGSGWYHGVAVIKETIMLKEKE